ncbi:MAG TPA: patatin-like phospholipase family protein [Dehalococcoidia bacterium]|nr:patatin-like phospholipase family protein [Dehalococcoidia bacterium]
MDERQRADAAFSGGGVKCIALLGALSELERYWRWERVAGTSGGAIVAAFVAAGMSAREVRDVLGRVRLGDLTDLRWEGRLERWTSRLVRLALSPLRALPPLRRATSGLSLVAHNPLGFFLEFGIYSGRRLAELVDENLPPGVRTFGDLLYDPTAPKVGPGSRRRYRLQVVAADITAHSLLVLPQDVARFGYDPDQMSIALALRMSASVPVLFTPVPLVDKGSGRTHLVVDGSVLSNYPLWLLDPPAGEEPAWPALGLTICPQTAEDCTTCPGEVHEVQDVSQFLEALWHSMASALDRAYLSRGHWERTVAIDCLDLPSTRFDLGPEERERLWQAGAEAARRFMARWGDPAEGFARWKALYGPHRQTTAAPAP